MAYKNPTDPEEMRMQVKANLLRAMLKELRRVRYEYHFYEHNQKFVKSMDIPEVNEMVFQIKRVKDFLEGYHSLLKTKPLDKFVSDYKMRYGISSNGN